MKFSKVLKKIFLTSTLGVLLPIMRIEGDNNDGNAGDNNNSDGDNNSNNDNNNSNGNTGDGNNSDGNNNNSNGNEGKIVFNSQAEFDASIQRRIAKAVKNANKLKDEEMKRQQMSESDRLKAEKEDADKRADEAMLKANNRLIRADIVATASKMNVVDVDAVYKLLDKEDISIDENGKTSGIEKAVKALLTEKPYLINNSSNNNNNQQQRAGDDQNNNTNNNAGGKFSMNNLIRKAAGRNFE